MYFSHLIKWEATLRPGDVVLAKWTRGYHYSGKATIVRFNAASVRVRLLEDVPWKGQEKTPEADRWVFCKGLYLTVPITVKFESGAVVDKWSPRNGIFPLEEPNDIPV